MSPDQFERLGQAVLYASPMLAVGAVMMVGAVTWPWKKEKNRG